MGIGEVWSSFKTEAVKAVMYEISLTKPGKEKDSVPVWLNNYLKKNAKNKEGVYKE